MNVKPCLSHYARQIKTIESHTMGEPTRIIYEGFPELEGETMMDKKRCLMEHYDYLREALMLEPRGHRDMFGALLTEPVHREADFGVIFMDSGSYLNMCGHGSIGVASMIVETGMVEVSEPYTEVALDTPSGVIRAKVHVIDGKAVEVQILNVPSFLYQQDITVTIAGWGAITFDISFGGSFFALVDAERIGLDLNVNNVETITELGMELLEKINHTIPVKHPYLDITSVDLVEFYSHTENAGADMKNCVVFGRSQVDRSPCGTGTSAKLAALYSKGELKLGEEFVYESITGTMFRGTLTKELTINGYRAVIPRITGSAYLTGSSTWIIDDNDPLRFGFLLGKRQQETPESNRSKLIRAAWELFQRKGYDETSIEDVTARAGLSLDDFYAEFSQKDDLEDTLGDLFDQKYQELILSMNGRITHYEKLLLLNQELFTMIEEQVPFSLVSHIYMGGPERCQKLLDEHRLYYKLIPEIIADGQKHGEFKTEDTPENLARLYASLERGLIYDWCVQGGKYSLRQRGQKLLPIYLREMLK